MINSANTQYSEALDLKVTDENFLDEISEKPCFRAYAYIDLVKTYGEVPLFNFQIVSPAGRYSSLKLPLANLCIYRF